MGVKDTSWRTLRLGPHIARVRSFVRNYHAVLRDVLAAQRRRLLRIAIIDFLGAGARGVMIGYIGFFVNVMQSPRPVVVPLVNIEIIHGAWTLAWLVAGVLVLNSFAAWAAYYSALQTRSVGRNAHTYFINEVLRRVQRLRWTSTTFVTRHNRGAIVRQILRNGTQLGIASEFIVRSLQPTAYFAVTLFIVFKLEAALTLILAPLGMLVLPLMYVVTSTITRDSRDFFQGRASEYGQGIAAVVAGLDRSTLPHRHPVLDRERFVVLEFVRGYLDGFDRNQLANDRMALAISTLRSGLIAVAIAVFGTFAMQESRSWGAMLAFVLALYYLVNSVQTLASYLASLTRFYPQLVAFRLFCLDADQCADRLIRGDPARDVMLRVSRDPLPESRCEARIRPGDRAYFYATQTAGRLALAQFAAALSAYCADGDADYIGAGYGIPAGTLREAIGDISADTEESERLASMLGRFGIGAEVAAWPEGLDTELTAERWRTLSPAVRAAIRIIPATLSTCATLLVSASVIVSLTPAQRETLWSALVGKRVFMVLEPGDQPEPTIADLVIVADGNSVIGIGDANWFTAVRDQVAQRTKETATPSVDAEQEAILMME